MKASETHFDWSSVRLSLYARPTERGVSINLRYHWRPQSRDVVVKWRICSAQLDNLGSRRLQGVCTNGSDALEVAMRHY